MNFIKRILPILCISVVTVIVSQLLYGNIMKTEEKRCWQELKTTVADVNNEIDIKLNDEISKLHLIETIMTNSSDISTKELSFLHLDKLQPKTIFARIDVLYPDNTLISNGKMIDIGSEIDYEEIRSRGEYLTERMTDFMTGKLCMYYVLPISDANNSSAVLIGMIDLEIFDDLFKPVIYNGEANICIIDAKDGNYIMDSWHKKLGNAYQLGDRKLLKKFEHVNFKEDLKNLKTGAIAFVSQTTGENLYMYYTPLKAFGWQTAVFAQEDVLFSNVISVRKKFFVVGIVELLLLLIYFLWNTNLIQKLQRSHSDMESKNEQLKFLSYRDMLTALYNRHKYMELINSSAANVLTKTGVAYVDLNGLKQVNDSKSHNAGDEYICSMSRMLNDVFGENCYRIGGDEFVVVMFGIAETAFERCIEELKINMDVGNVSAAVGYVWEETTVGLKNMLIRAEKKMYAEKKKHYDFLK